MKPMKKIKPRIQIELELESLSNGFSSYWHANK